MPIIEAWPTIVAIILGPVVAVLIGNLQSSWQSRRTAKREVRLEILRGLMHCRTDPYHSQFTRALVLLETAFSERLGPFDETRWWNRHMPFFATPSPKSIYGVITYPLRKLIALVVWVARKFFAPITWPLKKLTALADPGRKVRAERSVFLAAQGDPNPDRRDEVSEAAAHLVSAVAKTVGIRIDAKNFHENYFHGREVGGEQTRRAIEDRLLAAFTSEGEFRARISLPREVLGENGE